MAYLGGNLVAGGYLKETGLTHWNTPNTGATNSFGFTARGSGGRDNIGSFIGLTIFGHFWGSTSSGSNGYAFYLSYGNTIGGTSNWYKNGGLPIRLICDSTTDPGTVDIDGKRYNTVKIGDQVWLAENLKAEHYADGTPISEVTDNTAWAALTTPGLCAYNNDWGNV